jgi:RNA polymerase sigma-70 factor (ECF subfamily)
MSFNALFRERSNEARARADPEDIDLMRRAGAGDSIAQRVLVTRLMGRAKRLAYALLRDRDDACDVSQVALLAILRSAVSFRGDSTMERWADRIVVRTALRLSRSRRREAIGEIQERDIPSVPARSDAHVIADECLTRLTDRQRTALVLRSGFGYTIKEIGELTNTSVNTVKDRLKRARELVREDLGREQAQSSGSSNLRAATRRR